MTIQSSLRFKPTLSATNMPTRGSRTPVSQSAIVPFATPTARVVNQATNATGIDAGNTCAVVVANAAGTVGSKTYTNAVISPAANAKDSLGTITNAHCVAGDVMTLSVTQGTTANAGPFLVEVDYV